ncbi:MAG: fused MFS/spermidine synthase [Acidobacteriota bacterium]
MADRKKVALRVISFSIGFFAIILQVSFLREILVVFYGNELCIGLIFAIWLTGIFLGAFIASYGSGSPNNLTFLAAIILAAFFLLAPLQVSFIRLSRVFSGTPPGEYVSFFKIVLTSFLLVSPTSLMVGALFPVVARLFSPKIDRTATVVTTLYIWEAAGSLIGGLLFTFVFIPNLDVFRILSFASFLPALSIGMLSLLEISNFFKKALKMVSVLLLGALVFLSFFEFPEEAQQRTARMRWLSFAGPVELIAESDSKYQNMAISKQDGLYSIYFNGQYGNSFPDPYQSAIKAHLVMSQHPAPETILIIGGGYTGIIREILRYPVKRIDYVEIDPILISFVQKFLPDEIADALLDPRVYTHNTDGRHFVKFTDGRYDIILVGTPDPSTAYANRYYTNDFFREVKRKLNPSGLFVTSISSSLNYFGEEMLGYVSSVYHSIGQTFKHVVISPTEEAYFFASDFEETPSSEPRILATRFMDRKIESSIFTGDFFRLFFPHDRVEFVRNTLERNPIKEFNTDFRPITYFYSLKLWVRYSGSPLQSFLLIIEKFGKIIWTVLILLLLLLFSFLTLMLKRLRKNPSRPFLILCIASTGFAGMAWSLVLIFSFQNILGYLYGKIGLLVALFMLGLASGGIFMKLLFRSFSERILMLLSDFAALLFSFLLIPFLVLLYSVEMETSLTTEIFFAFLMFLSGFLTGFEFPVAVRLYLKASEDVRRSAGIVDAADHLGATFGAFLIGVLLIPLGGLWITMIAIATLKVVSFIVMLMALLPGNE